MRIEASNARLCLRPGQLAHLELASRTTLFGLAGQSWITFDDDPRDVVLGPGERFVVEGPVRALASVLRGADPAELEVIA